MSNREINVEVKNGPSPPAKNMNTVGLLFLVIVVWITISFWRRALTNLFFRTFKWNPHSTAQTLVLAGFFTLILIFVAKSVSKPISSVLQQGTGDGFQVEVDEVGG